MNLLIQPGRSVYAIVLLLATAGAAAVVYLGSLFRAGNWILGTGTVLGAVAVVGLLAATAFSFTDKPAAVLTATRSAAVVLLLCLMCEIAIVRPFSPLNAFVIKFSGTSMPHRLPFSFWVGIPTLANAAALLISNRKLQQLRSVR